MILPLENQVCSLESAKKLKELGVSQESLFYWCQIQERYCVEEKLPAGAPFISDYADGQFPTLTLASAYTVAELGELFPDWIFSQRLDGNRGWVCDGDNEYGSDNPYIECWPNNTEAEVRAKMLIYLIENKLMGMGEI